MKEASFKEEKALVCQAVTRYNQACDRLFCRVAETGQYASEEEAEEFSGRMKEFQNDCRRMRQIMEEYRAYLDENV